MNNESGTVCLSLKPIVCVLNRLVLCPVHAQLSAAGLLTAPCLTLSPTTRREILNVQVCSCLSLVAPRNVYCVHLVFYS